MGEGREDRRGAAGEAGGNLGFTPNYVVTVFDSDRNAVQFGRFSMYV